jgi:hypothetical protein
VCLPLQEGEDYILIRSFFYAGDAKERPHVHVRREGHEAKFWLDAVRLARNQGFAEHELNRVGRLVVEHAETLREAWRDYFEA